MKNNLWIKALALLIAAFMITGTMSLSVFADDTAADPFAGYSKWDGVTYDTTPFNNVPVDNGGGENTSLPVMITSAAQLAGLAKLVNEAEVKGNYGAYKDLPIYITVNIDLCGHEFGSIGKNYEAAMFSGLLEGRLNFEEGKPVTIANLKSSYSSKNNTGFISNLRGGAVKNITFVNAVVGNAASRYASGVVVGYASKNCEISGISVIDSTIIVPRTNDDTGAGGVVGLLKADNEVVMKDIYVENLTFACPDTFTASLGGIIGKIQSRKPLTIENGYFSGQAVSTVEGNDGPVAIDSYAAGFVAQTQADKCDPILTFKNCHYNGALVSEAGSIGGIAAFVGDFIYGGSITMENCLSTGRSKDSALIAYAGGKVELTMTNCYTLFDTATIAINDSELAAPPVATTVAPEALLGDTAKTTLAGFDFQNVWKANANAMPTLPGIASAEFIDVDLPDAVEVDYTALNEQIAAAEALVEAEYTAVSWAKLKAAVDAGKYALESAKQSEVDTAAADIAAAIAALEAPVVDPEPEDPQPEDPQPEDPKPEDPQPEEPEPKKGCGSSITLAGIAMVAVLGTAAVVVAKKKEND